LAIHDLHTRTGRGRIAVDPKNWTICKKKIHINTWEMRAIRAIDRDLPLRCVNALATEATLVQHAIDVESSRPHRERRELDEIEAEAAALVRRWFSEADTIADDAYQAMDPTTWFGAEANGRILASLGQAPTEAVAIAAFERFAQTLVGWWDSDEDWRRNRHQRRSNLREAVLFLLDLLVENGSSATFRMRDDFVTPVSIN
jgi:hypothetical protein